MAIAGLLLMNRDGVQSKGPPLPKPSPPEEEREKSSPSWRFMGGKRERSSGDSHPGPSSTGGEGSRREYLFLPSLLWRREGKSQYSAESQMRKKRGGVNSALSGTAQLRESVRSFWRRLL
jgi:hypothetical protein